jgi:signal transduction histidine kinase
MSDTIRIQNHPFPFLLYLEWSLLGIAMLVEALPAPFLQTHRMPLLSIVSMVGFGLIGLRLPKTGQRSKILYTGLQIGLLLIGTVMGGNRLFPFLYLILVIRSCLIFELPGRLLIAGLTLPLFLTNLFQRVADKRIALPLELQEKSSSITPVLMLNATVLFLVSLFFVLLLVNALLSERRSREELARANQQLRAYALRIENQATLEERNRIAREIHDSLGHFLTGLNIQLEGALKLWSSHPAKAQDFLIEAKRQGTAALQEVRQSVATLRSDPLRGQDLNEGLASLAKEFHHSSGILPEYHLQLSQTLPTEVSTTLYRIVQEALTNCCKYAAASKVEIHLETVQNHSAWQVPSRDGSPESDLYLSVRDNGKGFKVDQNTTGFGLRGMRERALALGGRFEVTSEPGKGCHLEVHVPLSRLTS